MSVHGVRGRVVDVVPHYRTGVGPTVNGHYTLYHDDLRRAAERLGVDWITFADAGQGEAAGVLPCLETSNPGTLVRSLARELRPSDLVVLYEGSLAILEAVSEVARSFPSCTFLVNLFEPEAGLDGLRPAPRVHRSPPENVIVTAETDERAALARQLGLPCTASWRLHSTVHDVVLP